MELDRIYDIHQKAIKLENRDKDSNEELKEKDETSS